MLKAGDLVAVYPEGTRSPDGRLYRGRTGAARLALAAGVPIIPVGMIGTEKVQPIGQPCPCRHRPSHDQVRQADRLAGRADDRTSLRQITDEVMSEIQKLTGQEYVPRYAPPRAPPGPDREALTPVLSPRAGRSGRAGWPAGRRCRRRRAG